MQGTSYIIPGTSYIIPAEMVRKRDPLSNVRS